jgi:hypothetical protein
VQKLLITFVGITLFSAPVFGSLVGFQTYTGNVYYSSDGMATLSDSGTISASVPAGSTVLAAYLYSASFNSPDGGAISGTLAGSAVTYGPFVLNPAICCSNGMRRADVTSIVKPTIDGGPGGVYDFTVTEGNSSLQDGEALVVVYSNAALPTSTVAILDGFSATTGDSFTANFGSPLDPSSPGFFVEMALGIEFSCGDPGCGPQSSNVTVNGTLITSNAGNYDDSDVPPPNNAANGRLLTVGGFNDPFSALSPSYADDHERYNLAPYVSLGDTQISVNTLNPSFDDNIFLAVFATSGTAIIVPGDGDVPEPATMGLLGAGLVAMAVMIRARRKKA